MRTRPVKPALIVAVLVAVMLISPACSSAGGGKGGGGDVIAGSSKQRDEEPAPERARAEPDGAIGDRVKAGDLSFGIFAVRAKDRVYAMSKPGASPVTRGDIESEYVAIDYLTKNVSGSPLTTGYDVKLIDDRSNSYELDGSIEPPSGGTGGMELGQARRRLPPCSSRSRTASSPRRS